MLSFIFADWHEYVGCCVHILQIKKAWNKLYFSSFLPQRSGRVMLSIQQTPFHNPAQSGITLYTSSGALAEVFVKNNVDLKSRGFFTFLIIQRVTHYLT